MVAYSRQNVSSTAKAQMPQPLTTSLFTSVLGVMGALSGVGLIGLVIWAKVSMIQGFLEAFRPREEGSSSRIS